MHSHTTCTSDAFELRIGIALFICFSTLGNAYIPFILPLLVTKKIFLHHSEVNFYFFSAILSVQNFYLASSGGINNISDVWALSIIYLFLFSIVSIVIVNCMFCFWVIFWYFTYIYHLINCDICLTQDLVHNLTDATQCLYIEWV